MRRTELALCVALAACSNGTPAGETLRTPAGDRSYILHLPANPPAGRYPLVIALHGGGGSPASMQKETRFDELADREGFAVVYPRGLNKHWNDGRGKGSDALAVDDVGYLRALIDSLAAAHPIDTGRVFATGISNGGIMSYRLACDLSDKIAAIAPVAGQLSEHMSTRCTPAHPVSVLAINGTADPQVPWRGGQVMGNRGAILGTPQSIAVMTRAMKCTGDEVATWLPDRDPADGTTVQHVTFGTCADGVAVELLNINHGGHTWPGGDQYLDKSIVGLVSRELSATERIWQFFATHGRRAPVRSAGG